MKQKIDSEKLGKKLMLKQKESNKALYILAFFLPMIVLELVYITYRIYPFGKGSLLVLDLNAQYIYYYEAFRDAFWGEGSFIYNWSRTLGGESFGLNAYYTGSPFMIIYALFPKKLITEALLATALLRTGCASLSFAYYLKKSRGGQTSKILLFSTMYALMAYMVIHQMDPMWLDALITLPLIMFGVEKLVKEGKFILFTVALTLTFISNFYIGYMVAIFTAAYFFFAYFTGCRYGKGNVANFFKKAGLFAFFSILSALMAAFMLIPAYFSLTLGKMDFTNPSFALKAKFLLFDMLPKLLFGAYDTCRPEGLPILYTGTLTLIMLPLYYTNKNINVKNKIMSTAILCFLFLSMNMSTVDMAWHGFQNPNWLNYRYSFILCAFMLVMGYEAFSKVRDGYTVANVSRAAFAVIALILLVDKFSYEYIDVRITVWGSIILVGVLFSFVAFDAHRKGTRNGTVIAILIGVVCAELYLNGLISIWKVDMDVVFSARTTYRPFVDSTYKVATWLKAYDPGFYRTEKSYTRTVNDPMAFGFKGISHSSSTLNADGIKYIRSLGYNTGAHWTRYLTPHISLDSMLGIKYVLQKNNTNNGLDLIYQESFFEGTKEEMTIYLYENPHAMPVCYPVDKEHINFEKVPGNPFEQLNKMFSAMVGSVEIIEFYAPVDPENVRIEYDNVETRAYGQGYTKYVPETEGSNTHIEFLVKGVEGKTLYAAFPSDYPRKVNIWINKEWYHTYLENAEDDGPIPLGQYSSDEEVSLIMTILNNEQGGRGEVFLKDHLFYSFDTELFEEHFAPLRGAVDEVVAKKTTVLTFNVHMDANQTLYMSIPYERGWTATVDGVKMEPYRTSDGLLGLDLDQGDYHVTLRFLPDYFLFSCVISGAGLVLFLLITSTWLYMRKKSIKLPTAKGLMAIASDEEISQISDDVTEMDIESGSGDTVKEINRLLREGIEVDAEEKSVTQDTIELPILNLGNSKPRDSSEGVEDETVVEDEESPQNDIDSGTENDIESDIDTDVAKEEQEEESGYEI